MLFVIILGICELSEHRSISDLRKKKIISQDGLVVGRIIDAVFDADHNLHSFIIGGSRWEELRELMGFIDDIDPVIPCKSIVEVTDDTIKIKEKSMNIEELKEIKEGKIDVNVASWLDFTPEQLTGKIVKFPSKEELNLPVEENLVIEYYSR